MYSGSLKSIKLRSFAGENVRVSVAIRESFSAKIYFQAIRYRASGCGALGIPQIRESFLCENNLFRKSFLPRKKPTIRYTAHSYREGGGGRGGGGRRGKEVAREEEEEGEEEEEREGEGEEEEAKVGRKYSRHH